MSDPPPADPQPPKPSARDRYADARRRVDELRSTAETRFEAERHRRNWVRLAVRAWERDRDRAGGLIAGGLAYRIFLWQIPAALFLVAVVGTLDATTDYDPAEVARASGMTAAVAATVAQGAEQAGTSSWILLVLGLWGMVWAGRGAARAVRLVSRLAYETAPSPVNALKASFVFNGFMFVAMFVQVVSDELFGSGALAFVLSLAFSISITLAVATFGMVLLPHGDRRWTVVLPGALLFGVAILAMRVGIEVYFANRLDRAEDLYGAMGMAIVILLVLYLNARVFVWGVFLSATFAGVDSGGESLDVVEEVTSSLAHEDDGGPEDGSDPSDGGPVR